jgi:hypothetical protein
MLNISKVIVVWENWRIYHIDHPIGSGRLEEETIRSAMDYKGHQQVATLRISNKIGNWGQ